MKAESQGGRKGRTKDGKRQVGQKKWHGDAPAATARNVLGRITVLLSRNAAMIRVQEAEREPKSKEAKIVFYLSCIVRYLRAQSAKEPESARWVGVLDVRVPHGYKEVPVTSTTLSSKLWRDQSSPRQQRSAQAPQRS